MDHTAECLRGWRDALLGDMAVEAEKRKGFSRAIEKYLLAVERHGWVVGTGSMKGCIEMAEAALPEGARWEMRRESSHH